MPWLIAACATGGANTVRPTKSAATASKTTKTEIILVMSPSHPRCGPRLVAGREHDPLPSRAVCGGAHAIRPISGAMIGLAPAALASWAASHQKPGMTKIREGSSHWHPTQRDTVLPAVALEPAELDERLADAKAAGT